MKPPILLCASLAAGICAGIAARWSEIAAPPSATPPPVSEVSQPGVPLEKTTSPLSNASVTEEVPLLGASEKEEFHSLTPEKQRDALLNLSTHISKGGTCGDQLLMARVVNQLTFEQTSLLLELLAKPEDGKIVQPAAARTALLERLAALNPERALELGKSSQDPKATQTALMALAQKSGAEALKAMAQLPEKFRGSVMGEMRQGFNDGIGKATGTLSELTAALKANPELFDPKSNAEGTVRRLVGQVASQAATSDPNAAMRDLRKMASELVPAGENSKAAESALVAKIASQMTRSEGGSADLVVFNSLAENEKNSFMVTLEAAAQFRRQGTDAAIQFAEKQSSEQFPKDAATGVWWALAQQDRPAALQWIESLPQGSFRDGALNSVMQESMFRTRSWGDTEQSIKAGMELVSKRSQLDYFAVMAQQRRGDGTSSSEFISSLPLTDADKRELRRRMAPIQMK
ncbi:MAG: hypothetical protein WCK17_00495 [Verrucomicrobiota bacterium]